MGRFRAEGVVWAWIRWNWASRESRPAVCPNWTARPPATATHAAAARTARSREAARRASRSAVPSPAGARPAGRRPPCAAGPSCARAAGRVPRTGRPEQEVGGRAQLAEDGRLGVGVLQVVGPDPVGPRHPPDHPRVGHVHPAQLDRGRVRTAHRPQRGRPADGAQPASRAGAVHQREQRLVGRGDRAHVDHVGQAPARHPRHPPGEPPAARHPLRRDRRARMAQEGVAGRGPPLTVQQRGQPPRAQGVPVRAVRRQQRLHRRHVLRPHEPRRRIDGRQHLVDLPDHLTGREPARRVRFVSDQPVRTARGERVQVRARDPGPGGVLRVGAQDPYGGLRDGRDQRIGRQCGRRGQGGTGAGSALHDRDHLKSWSGGVHCSGGALERTSTHEFLPTRNFPVLLLARNLAGSSPLVIRITGRTPTHFP